MLWIAQTVPVPVKTQVAARLLSGYLLVFAGSLLTLLATVFLLGFTVPQLIFGMVAGSCAAFPLLAAALIPDAIRPKRRWNSEAEAMKQNVNSILAMLLCMGLAVAIGLLTLFLQSLMPGWAAGCCVALVCFALGALLFSYAVRLSEKMMKTVDG
jgi:MFS family permease